MPTPAENFSAKVEAIKDAIALIVTAAAPNALVLKRFIFDRSEDAWVGHLRSSADVDADNNPRLHAIQIWYEGFDQNDDETPIRSIDPLLPFGVVFFHQYEIGTDADNSEKRLQKEVTEVVYTLASKPDLDLDHTCRHRGLRMQNFSLKKFGDQPVQIAAGTITVEMNPERVV